MKNKPGLVLTSIALFAALAVPAEGQSLGDAARREAERRSKLKETSKVYTTADLTGAPFLRRVGVPVSLSRPEVLKPSNTPETAQAAAPPVTASVEQKPELPKVREKRDEEHWRERAKVIRDRLNRLRSDAAAIEGRIASLQIELESAPASKAAALTNDITEANQDLTKFQGELRLIEDEWRAFEDRARQAKIPLRWIQ
ncbi:MAG: hypothetical protein WD690_12885 [Vicinamibacterales bacterium]